MDSIRNYNNTKCDLNSAKNRLDLLRTEKEHLYTKYFPLTSKLSNTPRGENQITDKMGLYLAELTKISKSTGMSLEGEIEYQRNLVNTLNYYLNLMEKCLEDYTGIEGDLYKEIVEKGINISKAVENIAERYNTEPRNIWKTYYPRIKKEIKKLTKSTVKVQ